MDNTLKTILRSTVSLCLAVAAIFLVFCEPEENSQKYLQILILSKTVGAICLWLLYRMSTPRENA